MAEQKMVRLIIERQDGPESAPYTQDYCSAIIIIALQKDCVKALSASAP